MHDRVALLALATILIAASLAMVLTYRIIGRLRRESDQPLVHDPTGTVVVPVRQLRRVGWISSTSNSLSPRLEIAHDGLHFRVFASAFWPFAEITRVNVSRMPLVIRIHVHRRGGRLSADFADWGKARDFLRALPLTLPFTPRAAALRDGAD